MTRSKVNSLDELLGAPWFAHQWGEDYIQSGCSFLTKLRVRCVEKGLIIDSVCRKGPMWSMWVPSMKSCANMWAVTDIYQFYKGHKSADRPGIARQMHRWSNKGQLQRHNDCIPMHWHHCGCRGMLCASHGRWFELLPTLLPQEISRKLPAGATRMRLVAGRSFPPPCWNI